MKQWWKYFKLKLRTKVSAFAIFLGFLVMFLVIESYQKIKIMSDANTEISTVLVKNITDLSYVSYFAQKIVLETSNHIDYDNPESKYNSENRIKNHFNSLDDYIRLQRKALEEENMTSLYQDFYTNFDAYKRVSYTVISLSIAEKDSLAKMLLINEGTEKLTDLELSIDNIRAYYVTKSENIYKETVGTVSYVIWFSVILAGIILLSFITFLIFLNNQINKPIKDLDYNLALMGYGDIPYDELPESRNEIGMLGHHANRIAAYFTEMRKFVREIGSGSFETKSEIQHGLGTMGDSLVEMQNSIISILKEYKIQKAEEKGRNWATLGYANFGDLLRAKRDNMDELYELVISNLVNYLSAVQGALFLAVPNEDAPSEMKLSMVAAYAYDRRKIPNGEILMGEGLVGRCALERKTIYITDIPKEHFKITSGLGESFPRSLLIVPMRLNDTIFGVIELASFNLFEKYQQTFVENIGESIATTISNVQSNFTMAKLLEQSQKQAAEMMEQDRLLRENLEKLKATQEEYDRREMEAIGLLNAVNHTVIRADYTTKGILTYANTKFYEIMGFSSREVEGRHVSMFLFEDDRTEFSVIWERLNKGGRHFEREVKYRTEFGIAWLFVTYTAVRDREGYVSKILFLAIDISKSKLKTCSLENVAKAVDVNTMRAELAIDGAFTKANNILLNHLGVSIEHLKGKKIFDLLNSTDVGSFKKIWRQLITGNSYSGTIRLNTNTKSFIFNITLSPFTDVSGNTTALVLLLYEQTELEFLKEENTVLRKKTATSDKEIETLATKIDTLNERIKTLTADFRQKEKALKVVYEGVIENMKTENKNLETKIKEDNRKPRI